MKLRIISVFMLFVLASPVLAQDAKVKYSAIVQAGFINGAAEPSWLAQFITGVKYKTFAAGIGIGLDYYRYKTAPLFIDVRKNIFDLPNTPFVYADIGMNFPMEKDGRVTQWTKNEFVKGSYYDLGAGYSWAMKKGGAFIMSFGYSQKEIRESFVYTWTNEPFFETMDYTLRRFSIKAGLRF